MSQERSTPTNATSNVYATSDTNSHLFAPTSAGLRRPGTRTTTTTTDTMDTTPMERFAMSRSDSQFNALAGAAGGFASGVVTCPLDVIKTKLQAQGGFRAAQQGNAAPGANTNAYNGMIGTAKVIWREEGLRGMYRGLGPIILGYLPTWAVWFTVYGKSKDYLAPYNHNPMLVNFYSSIIAGASSTMVTNPIWVIKTRLMSQVSQNSSSSGSRPPWHYSSTLDAARKMYRTEGIRSFYSGLTPALLGLTHVAVQFPAYEYLKIKFTGQGMGQQGEADSGSHWFGILSASVLSKILASSATYPHEVIRTRLQTQQRSGHQSYFDTERGGLEGDRGHVPSKVIPHSLRSAMPRYKGIIMTFQTILREEGWRAFYAGMGTNMMRAVPAATTTMLTYEFVIGHLNRAKSEGLRKEASNRAL